MVMAVMVSFASLQASGQQHYGDFIRFENLSVNEGLSQSTGREILQDSRGFIWIATQDGLNKYDGRNFHIYNNIPGKPGSLSDNFILSICEDTSGFLWIGTNGAGINRFNPQSQTFTHFRHQAGQDNSLSHDVVNDVYQDRQGRLWIGTQNGLNLFQPENETFIRYLADPQEPERSLISCIYEDSQERFWLGTNAGALLFDRSSNTIVAQYRYNSMENSIGGDIVENIMEDHRGNIWLAGAGCPLTRWDETSNRFTVYRHNPDDPNSISDNAIYSLYESHTGTPTVWIGTQRNGLNRYVPSTESFVHYRSEPDDPFSIANNIIFSLHESDDGTMWVGTGGGGISKFSLRHNKFHTFRNSESQLANFIWAIRKHSDHEVMVGTQNSGIYLFDRKTNGFTHYPFDPSNPDASLSYDVYTLYRDKKGFLWIGTSNAGLFRIHEKKNIHQHFFPGGNSPTGLPSQWVRCIYEAPDGRIWIGTANGLSRFNPSNGQFKNYLHDPADSTTLSYPTVQGIIQDHKGYLWVGTYGGGLNRMNPETEKFKRYRPQTGTPGSISNNRIRTIYEDSLGGLWIGTDHGINLYNREDDRFDVFTMQHGLPNNVIYSILPDRQGRLWLSTNRGLSVFNPADTSFINYDVHDGLQSNEFNTGAWHLADDGEMFFGGIHGFNIFHPDSIKNNPYIPPVLITRINLFNEPLTPEDGGIIQQCITATNKIRLRYNQNFLSFEFASFNFINSGNNQFRYKMEGVDPQWVHSGNRIYASYPDLKPGSYTFRVVGSNNDGIWNEKGDQLKVMISPPWWNSTPAWLIYAVVVILSVYSYIRWRTYKLAADKKALEELVKQRTQEIANQKEEIESQRDSLEELNAAKDKLFTIIGHDLKNPLTSLLSVSHTLRENFSGLSKDELQQAMKNVDQSAHNLFRLLENLLEWTRTQTGHLPIHRRHFLLNPLIDENITYLLPTAKKKNISLVKELTDSLSVYADKNMVSTVIRNLLNNAIKFTPKGGRIQICSYRHNNEVWIEVSDTGMGIEKHKKARLFRIAATASTRGTENEKGTGLGLLVCKDFVEKNGGSIWVDSQPGKGSTFTFSVPLSPYPPK